MKIDDLNLGSVALQGPHRDGPKRPGRQEDCPKGSRAGFLTLGVLLLSRGEVMAQKLEKVRACYNALTEVSSALWVSRNAGFMARNGLDLEFIYIESGSRSTQAMVADDIQIGQTGSGASIQARANGADTVIVLSVMPTVPFQVITRSDIKKPDDLRGKKIGISTFGSTGHFATRYFLDKLGLKPGRDVAVLQVGGQSARLAALKQGALDATLLGAPALLVAKRLGLHVLLDLVDIGFQYDYGSIATTRSFIRSNRDWFSPASPTSPRSGGDTRVIFLSHPPPLRHSPIDFPVFPFPIKNRYACASQSDRPLRLIYFQEEPDSLPNLPSSLSPSGHYLGTGNTGGRI